MALRLRQQRQQLKRFKVLRSGVQLVRRLYVHLLCAFLLLWSPLRVRFNRSAPHSLSKPLIVSLTSYPPRFRWLAPTLRCLLCQSVKPDKLILWIAHADRDQLPKAVKQLQAYGLTIAYADDLKSYKKLIPALEQYGFEVNHVIADDDMYYPTNWLATLLEHGSETTVSCHFSRVRRDDKGEIPTYLRWPEMLPGTLSPYGLLIGLGGVWFPPGSLGQEVCDYALASRLCPLQDDIWFSWHALMRGFAIKRVAVSVSRFSWPGADAVALSTENNREGGGNDLAVRKMIDWYGLPTLSSVNDSMMLATTIEKTS